MPSLLDFHLKKRARLKRADANDGQDQSYEQAMSDLAHVVLRDKAPALLDYEVGFQLVDRDEDDEKAIGVTVFKVGDTWLLAPMFFINGRVKGSELLYLKNQDLFVPLHEEWIDDILNKQPPQLGASISRSKGRSGISSPDLHSFNRPPSKWASATPMTLGEVKGALAAAKAVRAFDPAATLPAFLKKAGRAYAVSLARMATAWPKLASYLEHFHGDEIAAAIAEAPAKARGHVPELGPLIEDDHPCKTGSLQVYTYDAVAADKSLIDDLTNEEKAKVLRGPLIKDEREDDRVSVPYKISVERKLSSPASTGLYDVLVRAMTYEKCAVLLHPKTADGRGEFCTVVRLSDDAYANVHPDNVWVGKKYSDEDWADWVGGLPAADSLEVRRKAHDVYPGEDSPDESRRFDILVGPDMDATAPLYARASVGAADGGRAYTVDFDRLLDDCGVSFQPSTSYPGPPCSTPCRQAVVNLGVGRGSKLWAAAGNLYVPGTYKKLTATKPRYGEMPIQFGTPADVTMGLVSKTAGLAIKASGIGYEVNGIRYTADGALVRLVAGVGLREAAARELMKSADEIRGRRDPVFTCRVKLADPFLADDQPGAPGWPEPYRTSEQALATSVPGLPRQHQFQRVTDLLPDTSNYDKYDIRQPDARSRDFVQDAAESGRREIFDVSVMGSLLSATQGDLQVDQYLGPLVSALDALGRLLMNFYWHDKDFAERYGKDDLPDLEDTLRNSFINLGKVVINLKQKGITDPLDATRNFDLESLGDQQ